jgi:hypothetical protein
MSKQKNVASYAMQLLAEEPQPDSQITYIKPSSLAKGCLRYVAYELQEQPKPPLDARVGRILSVGTDSHRRLQRGFSRATLGQEVFFEVPEYRIHGFCDGILYVPAGEARDGEAGFWALEFKTTAASEFDKLKAAGIPKEEHVRQAQIYLWGIESYYRGLVQLKGAVVYYENRDTLEHLAFKVLPDPQATSELLGRVAAMLSELEMGKLTEDVVPPDHWAHRYCPFLEICEKGQEALAWQAQQPKTVPDEVLAHIIAKKIVAKKGADRMASAGKPKQGARSLADLAKDMAWE